jgi:hypothetical protein
MAEITAHNLSNPLLAQPILAKVLQHLCQPAYFKTALPLYRRLQFGRFLESSYLFTNLRLDEETDGVGDEEPWFYAFVDRGCRPETEVWLFGSWEVEVDGIAAARKKNEDHSNGTTKPSDTSIYALLLALLSSIRALPTPPSIHPNDAILTAASQLATTNTHRLKTSSVSSLPNPRYMLFGALSQTTTAHLSTLNLPATHLLPLMPNHTFLFPLSALPPPQTLPSNLRWGKLEPKHFPLVRSRTEIARQDFTLARLRNLAIFPAQPADVAPVAWAFVGLDGSLTTLHTEASHRRMGLAMALTAKLFKEEMEIFWEEGVERLAHGNVAVGNEASAGMCRRLGGENIGAVFWVKVDLEGRGQYLLASTS